MHSYLSYFVTGYLSFTFSSLKNGQKTKKNNQAIASVAHVLA